MRIPECVHPLSKHWDQPKNTEIEVDDTHALMSEESFEGLKEYSISVPTGVYAGKMWRAQRYNEWRLCWYEEIDLDNKEMCIVKSRIILIVREG